MFEHGKYIDHNPGGKNPGEVIEASDTVGDSLKIYSAEEAAFNIMNFKCKKQQDLQGDVCLGYSKCLPTESIKDLLSPELKKSRFVAFKDKFLEDMLFKKGEVGKELILNSKPPAFTNENFIYGMKNETSERAYGLIFPNKTPQQVKQEFLKWHDKYLISHNHYLPSERVVRNYNEHFNPHSVYGISKNADTTGQMVKKCLQQSDRMVVINKTQKKFQERTRGQLGQKIDRYNLNLDPNQTFGIQTKNQSNYDVRSLIENVEPCNKNQIEIIEAISYINKLRRLLFNNSDFQMYDLKVLLNKYDENNSGFIEFNLIMKALRSLQLHANEYKIRAAILHFQMLKNETEELVSVDKFWKMLHMQYPLPRTNFTSELNENSENKQTTYRLLCQDREKHIFPQTMSIKSEFEDQTTAGDLISPDIPMHYGLRPHDFKVLRPKEELRRIFKRVLPNNFDEIWEFAEPQDVKSVCKMSINEFRILINDYKNNRLLK